MDNSTPLQFAASDLEYFFCQSPHLLAILGEDGYFKRINSALENLLGCREAQLRSQRFLEFVHPEEGAIAAQLDRLRDEKSAIEFRGRFLTAEGRVKWLEWQISPFREDEDGSALFYCSARDLTERSTIKQAWKQRSDRSWEIFHQTFQLMWLLDPDGILLEANETALVFAGLTDEQVRNRPFWETPWWQVTDEVRQQLKDAIALASPGTFIRYEVSVVGANHTTTTLDFSLKPVLEKEGEVTLLIAEGREIPQHQGTDTVLRRLALDIKAWENLQTTENQRYAEAIENMQDGFYLWHLENPDQTRSFRLLLANPAAEKLSTVPNRDVLGRTLPEGFPQIFETELPEIYRQVVISGTQKDLGDVDYQMPSGETRTLAVKIFALAGRCLGVLFNDITEKRHSQRQLREQREQLKILFEQAGVGIGRLTLDGRWIQANSKLCEILGYSRAELLQTDFQSMTHPEDAAIDRKYYQAFLSGELDTAAFDKRYLRKDGESVWCRVTPSVIRDNLARPGYFIAFLEDITEQKAAALNLERQTREMAHLNAILTRTMTQLEQRNQELDRFAYVASHDLKAPLRAIANLATWIEEDIGDDLPEENRQQLELLQGRVHRMENLIDGLLAYSRAGRNTETIEEVDLNELLKEEIDLLAPLATLTIEIAPDLPTFSTNRVPLARVFANLISNAIKHHHRPNGRIEIGCQPRGDGFYEFSVADDGPGIDKAYHEKIFEIFQVLESRDKVESTGIGLAIVKKTVEAEGGQVSVESQVGRGTTFRFTWPMKPEP